MATVVSGFSQHELKKFGESLLGWYDSSRRELPWRKTRDPYRIWVSEIMLQQTRVAAVLEYYHRFLARFPNVASLAEAQEAEVLAAWSGLGYYRRARAMHLAANVIVDEWQGEFPRTAEGLENLPGIGRYTAAAISSIAFGLPAAVVDGNVERVLSRVLGEKLRDRNEHWVHANALLNKARPGDWNQAMMELGATVCLPADPKCLVCPVRKWCKEPGRNVLKRQPVRTHKELLFGLAERQRSVYLVQRSHRNSLMAGMWELPSVKEAAGFVVVHRTRHSITDSDYKVTVFKLEAKQVKGGKWVRCSNLGVLPVTGLTRKILQARNLWPQERI